MAKARKAREYRFEEIEDFDIDGAAVTVGIEHFPLGASGPCIRVNTGAIEVSIRGHYTDVSALANAFEKLRKKLAKINRKYLAQEHVQ